VVWWTVTDVSEERAASIFRAEVTLKLKSVGSSKMSVISSRLQGITSQKTAIFKATTVRNSNLGRFPQGNSGSTQHNLSNGYPLLTPWNKAPSTAFPKLVSSEKFMKCDSFSYIKIKNHKKWESEKQNKIRNG
jgi:hypothetical protein